MLFWVNISCVAIAVPPDRGEVAAVSTLVAGERPSLELLAATRASGTRIAALMSAPPARVSAPPARGDNSADPFNGTWVAGGVGAF